MKHLRSGLLFLACLVLLVPEETSLHSANSSANDLRISLEGYGISFARLPDWHFIQTTPRGRKLFDLIRLFETAGTSETNRQALYDILAARAYMIARPRSEAGPSYVQFAQRIVNDIRLQGYELVGSRASRDNGISLLFYVMHYRTPRDSHERDIWLSLRFFLTPKYIFTFYGSARSQKELENVNTLFSTIRFLTNRDGSLRQD